MAQAPLLAVNLNVWYGGKAVLRQASLEVQAGEVLGLVGQSGSGKSTLTLSVLGLLGMKGGSYSGSIQFQGRELVGLKESEMRQLRGRDIGLVLQSPLSSLNPALKIGTQLMEAWRAHKNTSKARALAAITSALESVSLPGTEEFLKRYPSQLSVGQAQRVLIAMATLHRPPLLLADEPTSALDVITQAEVLALFRRLNRQMGMGILFVSHDLLSVASLCDRIAILHEGEIVECGTTSQIFTRPANAYTRELIGALPERPRAHHYDVEEFFHDPVPHRVM